MEFGVYKLQLGELTFSINEVKRLLLSRDSNKKIIAVTTILKTISASNDSKALLDELINADVTEFLCEASSASNLRLLQLIFKCIGKLFLSEKFFYQNRPAFTLEFLIRTLHSLLFLDTNEGQDIFIFGLNILSGVLLRINKLAITLNNLCSASYITNLLKQIFLRKLEPLVIFSTVELILNIFDSQDAIFIDNLFGETVPTALNYLSNIFQKDKNKEFLSILCELSKRTLRLLSQLNNKLENSYDNILQELYNIVKKTILPTVTESDLCLNDRELMCSVLCSLLSFYHFEKESITKDFSEHLVRVGFLTFLPQLEQDVRDENIILIVRSLAHELLCCLSFYNLGEENWRALLTPGFEVMPLGYPYKNLFLDESEPIFSISSIVFNYFYLVSFSSPRVDVVFLKTICDFILLLREIPPPPITKAIWFIFAVAYLCNGDVYPESKVPMMKLIRFIGSSDLSSVYTHHPAVLYWAFSDSTILHELQTQIAVSWLNQEDEKSISGISHVLKVCKESCLLILEVLAQSDSRSSMKCEKLLFEVVKDYDLLEKRLFYFHAWSLLPTCLAKYSSTPDASYFSVANLMKYCHSFVPENIDIALVMRISCLLPGAFCKYFSKTFRHPSENQSFSEEEVAATLNTFKLVSSLFIVAEAKGDRRVQTTFFTNDSFSSSIRYFLASSNEPIITSILHLLTCCIVDNNNFISQSTRTIQLEGMKIIKFLLGSAPLSTATVKFLSHYLDVLVEKRGQCVVTILPPNEYQLRALYLYIHMLAAKSDPITTSYCWHCLRRLLELSESMGLRTHLALLPYTPSLLQKATEGPVWEEALKFICVWIKCIPTQTPRSHSLTLASQALQNLWPRISKTKNGEALIDAINKVLILKKPVSVADKPVNKFSLSLDH